MSSNTLTLTTELWILRALENPEDILFYESATEEAPIQPSRKGKDRAGAPSPMSEYVTLICKQPFQQA